MSGRAPTPKRKIIPIPPGVTASVGQPVSCAAGLLARSSRRGSTQGVFKPLQSHEAAIHHIVPMLIDNT
jgi:hypothetical protein